MKSKINQFLNQVYFPVLLLLICWMSVFCIYFGSRGAMLIDDGMMGLNEIASHGIKGYWTSYNADCFYYGQYGLLACLYYLCGVNTVLWLLFFSLFHAINATLIFLVSKKIYALFLSGSHSIYIALFGCLLFLLSPYQTENICWAATPHYAISLMILLIGMNWSIDYIQGIRTLLSSFSYFLLVIFSMVTLEITFVFPVVFTMLYFFLYFLKKTERSFVYFFLRVILPQCLLNVLYVVLLYTFKGFWMPHSVEATPYFPFEHLIISSAQHYVKVFGQVHFLSVSTRAEIYAMCGQWEWTLLIVLLLLCTIAYLLYNRKKEFMYLFLFLFLVSTTLYYPHTRLFFATLFRYEHSRYEYFGSVFLFQLLSFLVFNTPRWIRNVLVSGFIILFSINLHTAVSEKKEAGYIFNHFLDNYQDTCKGMTYLLNVPSYCNGALVFWFDTRVPISLRVIRNLDIQSRYTQIMGYVSNGRNDSFEVKQLDSLSWHFQLKTGGCWLMREGMGGSDYETDAYQCDVDEWGGYTIKFKQLAKNDDILCYTSNGFVRINE